MTSPADVVEFPNRDDESPLFARDAERALVADVLFHPPSAKRAAAIVTPADFADARLGQVYGLVVGMVSAVPDPDTVDTHAVRAEIKVRRKAHEEGLRDAKGARLLPSTMQSWKWDEVRWLSDADVMSIVVEGRANPESSAREILAAAGRRAVVAASQATITDAHTTSDPTTLAANAAARFQALRDAGTPTGRLAAKTLREVMETEDTGQDWVVPGLLERGDRLVVTGEEGLGKSTFLRQIALCAAAGLHPLSLKPIPPARVVIVDAENSERQWRRQARPVIAQCRIFGSVDPLDAVHIACVGRIDITSPPDLAAVHRLLDEHDPEILVIGPLYKLLPNAINNDTDAAPLIAALDSLRDRGVCLLMEAHAGHATTGVGGTRDLRPRGSAALLGWPEFGFGLGRNSELPQKVADVRRWRGDREERDWPDQLIRGGTMPWSDERHAMSSPSHAAREVADRTEPRYDTTEEPF